MASPNWQRLDIEKVNAKSKACKLENYFKEGKLCGKKLSLRPRKKKL